MYKSEKGKKINYEQKNDQITCIEAVILVHNLKFGDVQFN